ncbi:MAG: dihydroorotase [Clostridia bacterium]|nr:dihydroorotase [Clostridia bacterium]
MTILIKKARVIDPTQKLDKISDILIEDGRIKKLATGINERADKVIDATDCIAAPGFIDMHVHLRDPGFEYKEDIISGTQAALRGGFTSVVCMANTKPVIDTPELVRYIKEKAEGTHVNVYPAAAMTKGLLGAEPTDIKALKAAGAIAVSDDGRPVENAKLMLDVIRTADAYHMLPISHSEDLNLVDGGVINEGAVSYEFGLRGMSRMAEYMAIMRDVMLSLPKRNRIHIAHVSCKESVDAIRWGKRLNPNITSETAPHYVSLTERSVMGLGVNAKMNPPLRTEEDVDAVIEGLRDGTIDVIATDHAPHSAEDKGTIEKGAFGIVGLETALAVSYTYLVAAGKMSIRKLIRLMSTNPAAILGVEGGSLITGSRADVVIFDTEEFRVNKSDFASKSKNTPFDGMTLRGRVLCTISNGELVYKSDFI